MGKKKIVLNKQMVKAAFLRADYWQIAKLGFVKENHSDCWQSGPGWTAAHTQ
jgi:hypothetical protein